MANQGEQLPNHPVHADVQAGHREHGHPYRYHLHLLDAARALMLLGAAAAVATVGDPDADAAAQLFLAFLTWLLGVWLLSLVPVAGRFPQAADAVAGDAIAIAGAAIAIAGAVLRHLFTPWN